MKNTKLWIISTITMLAFLIIIVAGITGADGSEGGEGHGGEGEESGRALALDATYDEVRAGARLLLAYDEESNSFYGLAQNTTDAILENVRVEVHLSNGVELGPTAPITLEPGEVSCVLLLATEEPFEGWSPHAEVGLSASESGGGEHGAGESGNEGGGEGRESDIGEHGRGEERGGEHSGNGD